MSMTFVAKNLLARHYQPHVRSRGDEKREKEFIPGYMQGDEWWKATIRGSTAWGGFLRALKKKVKDYLAFLHLARAQLNFAKVAVFG
jgi:putative transposase